MPINEDLNAVEQEQAEIVQEEINIGNTVVFKIGDNEITFWQLLVIIVLFLILVK
jgi:hypothetical protein